jgi:hypothetical protein
LLLGICPCDDGDLLCGRIIGLAAPIEIGQGQS